MPARVRHDACRARTNLIVEVFFPVVGLRSRVTPTMQPEHFLEVSRLPGCATTPRARRARRITPRHGAARNACCGTIRAWCPSASLRSGATISTVSTQDVNLARCEDQTSHLTSVNKFGVALGPIVDHRCRAPIAPFRTRMHTCRAHLPSGGAIELRDEHPSICQPRTRLGRSIAYVKSLAHPPA